MRGLSPIPMRPGNIFIQPRAPGRNGMANYFYSASFRASAGTCVLVTPNMIDSAAFRYGLCNKADAGTHLTAKSRFFFTENGECVKFVEGVYGHLCLTPWILKLNAVHRLTHRSRRDKKANVLKTSKSSEGYAVHYVYLLVSPRRCNRWTYFRPSILSVLWRSVGEAYV